MVVCFARLDLSMWDAMQCDSMQAGEVNGVDGCSINLHIRIPADLAADGSIDRTSGLEGDWTWRCDNFPQMMRSIQTIGAGHLEGDAWCSQEGNDSLLPRVNGITRDSKISHDKIFRRTVYRARID